MPTTPNPTGGYFVMVPKASVRELDMSVDEALKYIISMGVVAPRLRPAARTRARRRAPRPTACRRPCRPAPTPRRSREIDRAASPGRRMRCAGRAGLPAPLAPATRYRNFRFPENRLKRTDYCGRIDRQHLGQTVTLMGWVHRRRDHGGVIFIDLRDREGLAAGGLRPGPRRDLRDGRAPAQRVRRRRSPASCARVRKAPSTPNLVSGAVEVLAHEIEILNASLTPPFQLDDENLSETVRLENRVLDLRRPQMQQNLKLRYRAAMSARRYLDAQGFIDIETPMLYKSTPEGAREFLVPSRVHHGQFYALPQSPQLFKQMLMMAGFDRYYQICKCFRDEDLRADRQPEFTQIDIETSFLDELEIREIMEGLVLAMFREALGVELPNPFPIMTFADAMRDYGSDKPDLRVPLKLTELTDLMRTVDFKVFRAAADLPDGRVAALCVPGGGTLSRKEIDDYGAFVDHLRREGPRLHQGQRRVAA